MAQTSVKAIPRTDLNAAGVGPAYVAINPLGLQAACFVVRIINHSNIDLDISYDGVTTHDFIHANGEDYFFFQMNKQPKADEALMAKGTIVYVSSAGAGAGTVMLTGYYV
jgi:hypothetical protein